MNKFQARVNLSIIICTYNSSKYLNDCFKSLFLKNNGKHEIVVIDDNSSDNTIKILKKWKKKFTFFQLIALKKNRGVSYCRNLGIKKSNGKYVSFCDSDDFYSKNFLKIMIKKIDLYEGNELFLFNHKVFNNLDKKIIAKSCLYNKKKFSFSRQLNQTITSFTRWNIWSLSIKKEFLMKHKIFFKNTNQNEDWLFNFNLSLLIKKFKVIDRCFYNYRIHKILSLGKLNGFVSSYSRLLTIINLLQFVSSNKKKFRKDVKKLFYDIIRICTTDFATNILACTKKENKKIEKIIKRNKYLFNENKYIMNKIKLFKIFIYSSDFKKLFYINQKFLKEYNQNIILFCAGYVGRSILDQLILLDIKPKMIIDNNQAYNNQIIKGIKIKNFKFLNKNYKKIKNSNFLICNYNLKDVLSINNQLLKLGVSKERIKSLNDHFLKLI